MFSLYSSIRLINYNISNRGLTKANYKNYGIKFFLSLYIPIKTEHTTGIYDTESVREFLPARVEGICVDNVFTYSQHGKHVVTKNIEEAISKKTNYDTFIDNLLNSILIDSILVAIYVFWVKSRKD